MNKELALEKLQEAKKASPERNFDQTVDMVINLKDIDFKKQDHQLDFYVTLHFKHGKKVSVCALVGPELIDEAKSTCDRVIRVDEFEDLTPKQIKTLAKEFDFFIAQANVMPKVAQHFGRVLGPRGKMPNPKAGCVVPPKATLGPLVERLQKTIRVLAKKDPVLHLRVGRQSQDEAEVADNIAFLYQQIVQHLPLEINNVKNGLVKLTMGKPVIL